MPSLFRWWFLGCGLSCGPLAAQEKTPAELFAEMQDDRFAVRQEASQAMLLLAKTQYDEVLFPLLGALAARDPELQARSREVLEKLYQIRKLGSGIPQIGAKVIWFGFFNFREGVYAYPAVEKVEEGGPADLVGLGPTDVLMEVDGLSLRGEAPVALWNQFLSNSQVGATHTLLVHHHAPCYLSGTAYGGKWMKEKTVKITLGASEIADEARVEVSFEEWLAEESQRMRLATP
ncbi:MAG: PDZ domain-containing protein [Verrucomicrobiota bacterium]